MTALSSDRPRITVVVCSLNGAVGLRRCLQTLAGQRTSARMEVIVVDDGSTDDTSDVGRAAGVAVIRHERNRGLAASRNAGIRRASGEIVAFLDDDCEADPGWVERLLAAYAPSVMGVGGEVVPLADDGYCGDFLRRHNPLTPLEIELSRSNALGYRLWLYLREQAAPRSPAAGRARAVNSLVGANMSFRRQNLVDVGLFDERFTFGAEELDVCWRMQRAHPEAALMIAPEAVVAHRFAPGLGDILRRGRAYGRGSARLYRKWPEQRITLYPFPPLAIAVLAASARQRRWLPAALAWPLLAYPGSVRRAAADRRPSAVMDCYLKLAAEHQTNVGFLRGLWEFRDLAPDRGA